MKQAPVPGPAPQPTKFLARCLDGVPVSSGAIAADVGCGFGRHTLVLAAMGYRTLALDYDIVALDSLKWPSGFPDGVLAVQCDIDLGIPLAPGTAHLVVAIEYPNLRQLDEISALVKTGGHLVMETASARGGNWMQLPLVGSVRSFLEGEFNILAMAEKPAGPPREARATVKVFAQRR